VSLHEGILTDYYLNKERKNWKSQNIELWNLMFGSIYLKILKNIHNNKSRTLSNQIARKVQTKLLINR
jgi:hypothetical protein